MNIIHKIKVSNPVSAEQANKQINILVGIYVQLIRNKGTVMYTLDHVNAKCAVRHAKYFVEDKQLTDDVDDVEQL